ncbi:unnamed protein product [Dicrocoelium dendriticum]|nr:unnamed protein product [Dicrocoelium dendriticum]
MRNFSRTPLNPTFQTRFGWPHFYITLMLLGSLTLCTIIGNVFVVAAVLLEKHLQGVSNYLIVSLAVADLMVATLPMPISAINGVSDEWWLGDALCDFWICSDVLCCTASILHLVGIALDRYWAVTNAEYIRKRTARRIILMIAMFWLLSVAISLPARLDLTRLYNLLNFVNHTHNGSQQQCVINQDYGYTIFSTVGAFYMPMIFMIGIYARIYQVARSRIRRSTFRRQSHTLTPNPNSQKSNAPPDVEVQCNLGLFRQLCVNCGVLKQSLSPSSELATETFEKCSHSVPIKSSKVGNILLKITARKSQVPKQYLSDLDRGDVQHSIFRLPKHVVKASPYCEFCPNGHRAESDVGSGTKTLMAELAVLKTETPETSILSISKQEEQLKHPLGFASTSFCPYLETRLLRFYRSNSAPSAMDNLSTYSSTSSSSFGSTLTPSSKSGRSGRAECSSLYSGDVGGHKVEGKLHTFFIRLFKRKARNTPPSPSLNTISMTRERQETDAYCLHGPTKIMKRSACELMRSVNCDESLPSGKRKASGPPKDSKTTRDKESMSGQLLPSLDSIKRFSNADEDAGDNVCLKSRMKSVVSNVVKLATVAAMVRRERIENQRERKAAVTLAIITGCFMLCWLPFFIVALISPFFPEIKVSQLVRDILLWLGYSNSLLNPIIYTIFSPDFRNAFSKVLFGRYYRHSMGR